MSSIKLKQQGEFFGQHDPQFIAKTEVRSFRSKDGREYMVKRYPRSDGKFSYHVYMEVSNPESFRHFIGADADVTDVGWWKVWPEERH